MLELLYIKSITKLLIKFYTMEAKFKSIKKIITSLFFICNAITVFSINDALKLRIENSSHSDETIVRFHANATEGFDSSYDAWKFFSSNPVVPSLYTKIDSTSCLSINAMPSLIEDRTTILFSKVGSVGSYTIVATEIGAFASNVSIILEDTELNINIDVRANPTYSFNVTDTGYYNSHRDRFKIHFSISVVTEVQEQNSFVPQIYFENDILKINHNCSIKEVNVYDLSGKLIIKIQNSNSEQLEIDMTNFKNRLFIIEMYANGVLYRNKTILI